MVLFQTFVVMDSINYLSPGSSFKLIKSENLANLFGELNESNDLIKCIDANDLTELKQYFFPNENDKPGQTQFLSEQFGYEGISLNKEEFVNVIQQIFGKERFKLPALKFFENLQKRNVISNSISWCNIVDTIVEQCKIQILDVFSGERQSVLEIKNRYSLHCGKDLIIQIFALETINSFCYTVVFMCGKIGIYDEELDFSSSYNIPASNFRRINKWISSASYTSSGSALFFSTLDRSLYIYNTSRLNHRLRFIISELLCIITCMKFGILRSNGKLLLLIGDDLGNVCSLTFHQHLKSFFKEKPNEEVGTYFWSEIKTQTKWVSICVINGLHKELVLDIEYITQKNLIISCSKDFSASIVITKQGDKKMVTTSKLRKGLQCLAYDQKFGYLATSSSDKTVCLWNLNYITQCITNLHGHEKNVIDLHFLTNFGILLSISEEGVLKLWSMETFKCFQTIQLDLFSPPKNHFCSNIIFERLTEDMEDSTNKDTSKLPKSVASEVLIASTNTVTIFSVVINGSKHHKKKPLPIRNLEPISPRPEMIFKYYNRENSLSFKELHEIKAKEVGKVEEITHGVKQFVKKGVPHLNLKIRDINENYFEGFF